MPLSAERRVLPGKCRLDGIVQRMTDGEMLWTCAPIIIVKNYLVMLFRRQEEVVIVDKKLKG